MVWKSKKMIFIDHKLPTINIVERAYYIVNQWGLRSEAHRGTVEKKRLVKNE